MVYETYCLGDVCNFIDYRGKTPPKATSGIPLITAKIIKSGKIQKPQEFIAESYYDEWMRRGIPKKGSVIFTTEAPLGEVARIHTNDKLAFAQRIIILEPKVKQLRSDYLFYALQDRILKNKIEARATGTTVTGIKAAELKKVEIDLPPLEIQERISSLLCSLDDKIELNNNINENLGKQAQAVFKSWFIDNLNVGTWQLSTFSGLIEKTISGDWGKDKPAGKSTEMVYCIRGADIPEVRAGNKGKMPIRYILPKNYESKHLVAGDIVVEISGGSPTQSTGRAAAISSALLNRYDKGMVCTNFCKAIKPKPGYSMYVYYYWQYLYDMGVFFSYENGTTGIKNLDINGFIETEPIHIAPKDLVEKFDNLCQSIFSKVYANGLESERLAELRDILLPKLMSGEINVSNLEV